MANDDPKGAADPPAPSAPVVTPYGSTIYQAAAGYDAELRAELGREATSVVPGGPLFALPGPPRPAAWAANVWIDPVRIRFGSIAEGARALSALGRNWSLLPTTLYRRAALLAERLPNLSAKPLVFPPLPGFPLGACTLVEPDLIVAAARSTSRFPNGEASFVEDRESPPSRAYLKLWEAFTVAGRWPGARVRCVDLGSSPGGWTWVLAKLGARVLSVDKAPLAQAIMKLPNVEFRQGSAFAIEPKSVGRVDWVVSDIICYPERIVTLVESWLEAHPRAQFVVTIKFQGETDMAPLRDLATMPGARLVHLHNNKHELTWLRLCDQS